MSKYIITSNNKITDKQIIIIDGEKSCEFIDDKLVIHNAIKLKPFISINNIILIHFNDNLYLLSNAVLMFMKNDTADSNLTNYYIVYCSYDDFISKVKDNKIELNDVNSLFKHDEDSDDNSDSYSDESEFNVSYCNCIIM